MSSNLEKKMKALISSLIVNDNKKTEMLVNEISESILPDKEDDIMKIIMESFEGDANV